MRLVLIGAVESTRIALETFVEHRSAPIAVVTLPGEKAGRHSDWVDLSAVAGTFDVPVIRTGNINDPAVVAQLRELEPDYIFVIGWSQILKRELLETPSGGCIGFHPAPLPENRGRSAIPWTILQGRLNTGSTLFWMDDGMDTGDILAQERFPVAEDETARTLYDRHLDALRHMLGTALPDLATGHQRRVPQDSGAATYCARRTADDGLINWQHSARAVWTLVRAVGDPYPGAFTFRRAEPLKILHAELVGPAPYYGLPGQVQAITPDGAIVQCGDGEHVRLRRVQLDGQTEQHARDVLNLHERLGVDWLALIRALRPVGH